MLGYVAGGGRGSSDRLLAAVAERLRADGFPVAGVVQVNTLFDPARPCHMDLMVLSRGETIRISQNLGPLARGCRLDPSGLETAVGHVERALEAAPRLLIVNKFGKVEAEGRGFRPVIGAALAQGVPVLTSVSPGNLAAFEAFAEGLAEPLPADEAAILDWCRAHAD
jgi:nucleoside-triphosphatase THEP1